MHDVHIESFDWNLLLAFDALATERNVTRAAKRIGLSQSAMSHALSRLRAQLGDPLFNASAQGMVPTARAVSLHAPIREAIALVKRTLEKAPEFDPKTEARTFTISTTDFGAMVILPSLLARLAERAPFFDLVIRPGDSSSVPSLRRGEHDIMISVNTPVANDLRIQEILRDEFVCVRRMLGGKRVPKLTLERYLAIPHVLVSPMGQGDAPVDVALRKQGQSRRIILRLPHFLVAPLALAESDYVMTLPSRLAAEFADLLPLQIEAPPVEIPGFGMEMVWHERSENDPAHRFLREQIAAVIKPARRAFRKRDK